MEAEAISRRRKERSKAVAVAIEQKRMYIDRKGFYFYRQVNFLDKLKNRMGFYTFTYKDLV
jgi:hypothetical protein